MKRIIPVVPYTWPGHVPGPGVALSKPIPGGRIIKMAVGGLDNNVYLVQCTTTYETVLIDAANDAADIVELVKQECPDGLALIVTTHEHIDHWWALSDVATATSAPSATTDVAQYALPVKTERILEDQDDLAVGTLKATAIRAVGHTPGSVLVALADAAGGIHLFSGDSLFPGGLGKTPDADAFASLYRDITTRVFERYPDNTVVHPGHGDDTTLGDERPHLLEWVERGW